MSTIGRVYFLRHSDFVKIGFSTDYVTRCATISACTPEETSIIATHVGTQADEARFHRLLAAHNHRLEWFRWCPEVEALAINGLPARPVTRPEFVSALTEAKRAVGGPSGLARALGDEISPQAISQWKRVPADRAAAVERATGIPRHRLRPDLFEEGAAS